MFKDFDRKFWLNLAGVFLSLGWVLPNHYPPWTSFHSDFFIAAALLVISIFVFSRLKLFWDFSVLLLVLVCCIPIVQHFLNIIPDPGITWINCAYLLGLLLCILVGFSWSRHVPNSCADLIFLAFGIAGLVSVGIELHQWLMMDSMEFWVNRAAGRPSGNLSQPNQLATLLLLAVLGVAWHFQRNNIRITFSFVAISLLILGVALTQSRTGWVNLSLLLTASFFWGFKNFNKKMVFASLGFFLYFLFCVFGLPHLHESLNFSTSFDLSGRGEAGIRPIIWNLLWHAALLKPWFGYGWGQTEHAHLALATDYQYLGATFAQAHNIFLDLIVWNGLIIGALIIFALTWRFCRFSIHARRDGDIILLMALVVLGVHAMLEYPLHYAYFLLPAGLIFGALSARLGFVAIVVTGRTVGMMLWLVAAAMLMITLRDYSRVEVSFSDLRFEKARIQMPRAGSPPDVWILTQLRDSIILGRVEITSNMTEQQLDWMQEVTKSYPSAYNVRNLAFALAMNNRGSEAQHWLRIMCKALPEYYCEGTRLNWQRRALQDPRIAAVPWPVVD